MQVKNWNKFQHFKDRRPPWIKLYRDILDDINFHELDGDSAKALVMIWLIASEGDNGTLPDIKTLAFRLRLSEKQLNQILIKLKKFLIQDDIKAISGRYQSDSPERETEAEAEAYSQEAEAEAEIEYCRADFTENFELLWSRWKPHPSCSKGSRQKAKDNYIKALKEASHDTIIKKSAEYLAFCKNTDTYTQHIATWLSPKANRGWDNAYPQSGTSKRRPAPAYSLEAVHAAVTNDKTYARDFGKSEESDPVDYGESE